MFPCEGNTARARRDVPNPQPLPLRTISMNKNTHERNQQLRDAFCRLRSVQDLCRLLKIDKRRLTLMAKQPRYKSFSIPKKGGGQRHIETPDRSLKKLQSQLNRYLQSVYFFEKSSAAYGFILGVRNDDDRRNVVTNAKKHLGHDYLLNVDLKDFFHGVKRKHIMAIFEGPPFHFQHDLPGILTKLTTYKGRLPMGTPTSPVLSNLACRKLDADLSQFAEQESLVYTRYADDLSFSSARPFTMQQGAHIRQVIKAEDFKVNERKVKVYGPEETKIVTGLVLLEKKVALAPEYLDLLQRDVDQLKQVMEVQNTQGELSSKWVDQFKLQVRGRLNFAGFVLGRRNQRYIDLKDQYYTAINPPEEEFGAVSWRSFPYNL